jgi:hypothetical protein
VQLTAQRDQFSRRASAARAQSSLPRGDGPADLHEDEGRIRTSESKAVIADSHDTRAVRSDHAHWAAGTKPHFAEPVDVLGLAVNLEDRSRFSGCKVIQGHDLAAGGNL